MLRPCAKICLFMLFVMTVSASCQREEPTEKAGAQPQQPAGVVERAVQQTIDGIKGPMDKARSVEGVLEKSAERVGEQVQDTAR